MNTTQKKPQVNFYKAAQQMIQVLGPMLTEKDDLSDQARQEMIDAINALIKIKKYF